MELEGFREITEVLHCVVYALVYRREVVYVGQTRQPLKRFQAHINGRKRSIHKPAGFNETVRPGIQFDQVFIRPCMLAELDGLETAMIARYRPKHNQRKLPPVSAKELELLVQAVLAGQTIVPEIVPLVHIQRRF